jgi:hypothetical protein
MPSPHERLPYFFEKKNSAKFLALDFDTEPELDDNHDAAAAAAADDFAQKK